MPRLDIPQATPVPRGEVDGTRDLWAEVLAHGIREALRARIARANSRRPHGPPWPDEAWVGGRDFACICTWAGLDPDAVEGRLRRALATPDEARRHLRRFGGSGRWGEAWGPGWPGPRR